jgi:hypothetical protein
MDIDAAIERMRILADANADSELAIVWEAIDGWLSNGGYWPDAWLA